MSRPHNFVLVERNSQQPLITEDAASRNWELLKGEPDIHFVCADNWTVRLHTEVFLCHSKTSLNSEVEKMRRRGRPKPRVDISSVDYLDLVDVAHLLYSGEGSIPAVLSQNDALAKQESWKNILYLLGVEADIIKKPESKNPSARPPYFQFQISFGDGPE